MNYVRKISLFFLTYFFAMHSSYAAESTVFGQTTSWTYKKFRDGDFNINDIPILITGAINFALWIAGTIAIIFIIIGAYHILLWDIATDKSKGKEIITKAITWFAIAVLSWSIIQFVLDNFA